MSPAFPRITAFPAIASLVEEFPKAEAFLVGGAVRDILLEKKITDIDLVVRNVTADELGEFLARHGRVVFVGKQFGVWKFNEIGRPRNEVYDIALPRTEFSLHKQGMYRDFRVKTNPRLPIQEDLSRRDFTVNAMAYHLIEERLIDPHAGQKDVQDKLIRAVGNAEERFKEDYSRILRAIRFSLALGFGIEEKTLSTVKRMMPQINSVVDGKRALPYEVIAEEFLKSLAANPVEALKRWDETGALAETVPELLEMKGCVQPENWHTEGDAWEHALLALEKLSSDEFKREFNDEKPDLELMIAVAFHDIGKPYTIKTPEKDGVDRIRFDQHDEVGAKVTREVLNRLRVSAPPDAGVDVDRVAWMIEHHMLLVHGKPENLRPDTIEKYFFSSRWPSRNFLKLLYADGAATISTDGKGMTALYDRMKERIAEIKKKTGSHGLKLAKPLLTGKDVMDALATGPGPRIGKILQDVRAKQLSGELKSKADALAYIQNSPSSRAEPRDLSLLFTLDPSAIARGDGRNMKLTVEATDNLDRLDRFLTAKLPGTSRSFMQKRIKAGSVMVNGKNVTAHYKPKPGDVIEIAKVEPDHPGIKPDARVRFDVVDETPSYLVIEKGAGLVVHPAPGISEPTLADGLVARYPELANIGDDELRPGIAHRLDRDVSGLMVIARTKAMFEKLKRQFQNRTIEKQYTALVHGVIDGAGGVIDTPIGRSQTKSGKMAAHPPSLRSSGAKEDRSKDKNAKTEYRVLGRIKNYTLLEVRIRTGRSHQIRVHLHSIGNPIVGDTLYTNKRVKHKDLGRIFLHASKLSFDDLNGERRTYESKLPKELQNFYETLN